MKLEINLKQIQDHSIKDKMITIRIPMDEFDRLKKINANISHTIRVLVTQFLAETEKERKQWTRK